MYASRFTHASVNELWRRARTALAISDLMISRVDIEHTGDAKANVLGEELAQLLKRMVLPPIAGNHDPQGRVIAQHRLESRQVRKRNALFGRPIGSR